MLKDLSEVLAENSLKKRKAQKKASMSSWIILCLKAIVFLYYVFLLLQVFVLGVN